MLDVLDWIEVALWVTPRLGGLHHWYMEHRTAHWPVIPVATMHRGLYEGAVIFSYSYWVGGERYGGYQRRDFYDSRRARQCLDRLADPLPASVRHDPRRPQRSWLSV